MKYDIITAKSEGVSWRIFENECMERYFGQSNESRPEGIRRWRIVETGAHYMYWKLHTESTDPELLKLCCRVAKELTEDGRKVGELKMDALELPVEKSQSFLPSGVYT